MGIEPTRDPCEPHTGFEDQGHHQAPVTSAEQSFSYQHSAISFQPSMIRFLIADFCMSSSSRFLRRLLVEHHRRQPPKAMAIQAASSISSCEKPTPAPS